jgi:hypothetical protein
LSLVTLPNSSTPVSSGMAVILPTPHSMHSSRRPESAKGKVEVSATSRRAAERKAMAIGLVAVRVRVRG